MRYSVFSDVVVIEPIENIEESAEESVIRIGYSEDEAGVGVVVFSSIKSVRAKELCGFLLGDFGLVKGDANKASTSVPALAARLLRTDNGSGNIADYLSQKVKEYYEDCVHIDLRTTEGYRGDFDENARYKKKDVQWAVVKSEDIAPCGTQIRFKTLENESGHVIEAGIDKYIMIGIDGETYDIDKVKFEHTYELTGERLDIFTQMFKLIPEVKIAGSNDYICLEEKALMCRPKGQNVILAQRLEKRAKVYYKDGEGDYYLGKAGDVLACRADDRNDIYVIQGDIFETTYERV